MLLINCKFELSLKWIENCVLTTAKIGVNAAATGADSAKLEVTDAKLCSGCYFISKIQCKISKTIKRRI